MKISRTAPLRRAIRGLSDKLAKGQGGKEDAEALITLTDRMDHPDRGEVNRRIAELEETTALLKAQVVQLVNAVGMKFAGGPVKREPRPPVIGRRLGP